MTDTTEQKALALIKPGATCEVNLENISILATALCRAIEQHEAFRQEVSDAVTDAVAVINNSEALVACEILERFIIWKPDPLVEAMHDCGVDRFESWADQLRAAIEKRGGKIVWGEG